MTVVSKAAAVRFDNVTKAFGEVVAVRDLCFTIEAGRLVTLLGPSGCGKTTTLRLIAGLEMATSGAVFIGEVDVTRLAATERDVSMVFQSYALFPHMTVMENVAYGLKISRLPKDEVESKANEGLALVGLAGYGERLPSELSGGQQQRVAVARALVLEPQVLLFDEPLSNLDAKLRRRVRDEIRELQQNLGLTSVYVTHDQEEALAVSDRIIVMNDAVIAQEGTPRDLYEWPADEFVADFIGDANMIAGEIVDVNGETARVAFGGVELALPHRGMGKGEVGVAVRPDAVRVSTEPTDGPSIEGTIGKAAYLGGHMEYTIETEVGQLFVTTTDVLHPIARDAAVHVGFADHGVSIVQGDVGSSDTEGL